MSATLISLPWWVKILSDKREAPIKTTTIINISKICFQKLPVFMYEKKLIVSCIF